MRKRRSQALWLPNLFTSRLEPGNNQSQISHAGDQQADGQGKLHTVAERMEGGSHGRDHPAILRKESRGFFFSGFTTR
jgi:hypothetical protein